MMVKYITVEVMNGPMKEIVKPEGESKHKCVRDSQAVFYPILFPTDEHESDLTVK
jgi:hypothetical protein